MQKYPQKNIWATMRTACPHIAPQQQILGDLCQENFVNDLIAHTKPQIIVHCAAITNLLYCEQNPDIAHQSHCIATEYLAKSLAKSAPNAQFVYISTDSVFDGKTGNYTETCATHPLNVYAHTKLQGEAAAQYYNKNALILRTNIFGTDSPNHASLAEWILKNLTQRTSIDGFENVCFNPLYTHTLAQTITQLTDLHASGILNAASPTIMTKYEFALCIAYALKIPASLVRPTTLDAHTLYPARPLNTTLNTQKIQTLIPPLPSLAHDVQTMMLHYIQKEQQ
jgi:dTDP-4-dehydrorhamnose reductase